MRLLLAGALAGLTACAPIATLPPVHTDEPISTRDIERVRVGFYVGRVVQEGTTVHLQASQACDLMELQSVSRTTTVRHENRGKWLDASIGILAAGAIGAGTWLMIDSSKVHESDKTSRTYNPTGPTKALAYGVATTAGGVALLSIPIVDVVRARRVGKKTDRVSVDGEVKKSLIACSGKPAANAPVSIHLSGTNFRADVTDASGKADVDLGTAIPADVAPSMLRGQAQIEVGDEQVGTFDTGALYDAREDQAWRKVDVEACRTPTTPESCASVAAFAMRWSQGAHFSEADALLSNARPHLAKLLDDRVWAGTNIAACESGPEDPEHLDAACHAVERTYLGAFPNGLHSAEARLAIEQGLTRSKEIRERLARAAARQAAQDQRRAERAAAKECRSRCQMGCSSWQVRDEGLCLAGCLDRCGGE